MKNFINLLATVIVLAGLSGLLLGSSFKTAVKGVDPGTAGTIPKYNAGGDNLVDSLLSESGVTVTSAAALVASADNTFDLGTDPIGWRTIYIATAVQHANDSNTKISFSPDSITLHAGGAANGNLTLVGTGASKRASFNDAQILSDVDFIVKTGGSATAFVIDDGLETASFGIPLSAPNLVLDNAANEYTKQQNFNATTLTDAANIAWNLEDNQVASVTLAGNRTLDNPTNQVDGAVYVLTVKQDGVGGRTLAFDTAYKFPGGTAPTLSTGINDIDILTFVSDGTNMFGVIQQDFS